jgi:cytochrome oxidase Cu insertion factor (SCO1/SenC/PrrC family)
MVVSNRWLTRLAASCVLTLALCAVASADGALQTAMTEFQLVRMGNETPPPFALETLDGSTLRPGDLKGRAVLLYFWATW